MISAPLTVEKQATSAVESAQGHHAHVAHHFESAQQQFDAGKLGMWLFLVTEVLFFSGLFVAYAVYRANHPEVFIDAHKYLNTTLGTFNTIVLLLSSLTMAWAVRCAQLGQQRALILLLAATLACASLFLGVKAVEYSHKWGAGLLWAGSYSVAPVTPEHVDQQIGRALLFLSVPAVLGLLACVAGLAQARWRKLKTSWQLWLYLLIVASSYFVGVAAGQTVEHFSSHSPAGGSHATDHQVTKSPAIKSPATDSDATDGYATTDLATNVATVDEHTDAEAVAYQASAVPATTAVSGLAPPSPPLTGVFFSIYYAMTGVHAIHILAGMGVMIWLLRRSLRGDFGPEYFSPVDFVGLYWHLVDLVWIYLFPLLYLIR